MKSRTSSKKQITPIPIDLWDPAIQKKIGRLINHINTSNKPFPNRDVVQEIVVTALKAVQAQIGRGDLKLLSRSLRELRYAFKIFQNYRATRKVTIFGSARSSHSSIDYKLAKEFSSLIAQRGYMVITGAGPGIMKAGNEGASPERSFGINIRLPFEQFPNEFIAFQPTYIDCRYFFTRKLVFVKETSAVVVFPGGFGTLDEAFEILTLVQTGKSDPVPIIFIESPKGHMWIQFSTIIRQQLLRRGMISKEDLHIFRIVHSANEAVEEIERFYSNYHSIRYVKDFLVMRLQTHVTDGQLRHLNKSFKDILKSGRFQRSGPLQEEKNQPELDHLPRLIFKFNRVNNGRLRMLIDYLNRP